jgi:hypothetical protein
MQQAPIWATFSEGVEPRRCPPRNRRQRLRQLMRQAAAEGRRNPRPISLAALKLPPMPADEGPA